MTSSWGGLMVMGIMMMMGLAPLSFLNASLMESRPL